VHAQRPRERAGEDAQERDEPAEEDGPHAAFVEDAFGVGEVRRAEMLREFPARPGEQPLPAGLSDQITDAVADDGAGTGQDADPQRIQVAVLRGQQGRADQHDLTRERDAEALDHDHHADDQVHRERRDRLQPLVDVHYPYPLLGEFCFPQGTGGDARPAANSGRGRGTT
jgi:hypothetical protein